MLLEQALGHTLGEDQRRVEAGARTAHLDGAECPAIGMEGHPR